MYMVSSKAWWKAEDEDEAHKGVMAKVDALGGPYQMRRERWRRSLELYLDRMVSLTGTDDATSDTYGWTQKSPGNVVASVVQTVHSNTLEMRPRPTFMTVGGSYALQEKAKNLTKVIRSELDRHEIDHVMGRVCLDALIGDCGVLGISVEHEEPTIERIVPTEIIIDPAEYHLRQPLTYYRVRHVDREALAALYPDSEEIISDAAEITNAGTESHSSPDTVEVVEAIRLPLSDDHPGKRVVCVSSGCLEFEDYTYDFPPYIFMRWTVVPNSFWGMGLAEQLAGIQADINRKDNTIREHEYMVAGKWLVEMNSQVETKHLDNEIGIVHYMGTPPQYIFPTSTPSDLYQSREASVQAAYSMTGVSALSAAAEKPAGLNSGKALRSYDAISSKRFLRFQRDDFERAYLQVGRMLAFIIHEDEGVKRNRKYKVQSGKSLQVLTYKDVNINPDDYDVKIAASSFYATEPSALLQELQEYYNTGLFSSQQVLRLQQTQDLESEYDIMTAPQDLADNMIETMLREGEYLHPEPFYDLGLCLSRASLYYQKAVLAGVEEDRLALLRRWIQQCADLKAMSEGNYPGQAPPPAMGPEGPPPMPPPQDPMQAQAQGAVGQGQVNNVQDAATQGITQ